MKNAYDQMSSIAEIAMAGVAAAAANRAASNAAEWEAYARNLEAQLQAVHSQLRATERDLEFRKEMNRINIDAINTRDHQLSKLRKALTEESAGRVSLVEYVNEITTEMAAVLDSDALRKFDIDSMIARARARRAEIISRGKPLEQTPKVKVLSSAELQASALKRDPAA